MRSWHSYAVAAAVLGTVQAAIAAPTVLDFFGAAPADDQPVSASYGDNAPNTPNITLDFAPSWMYFSGDYGEGLPAHIYPGAGDNTITLTASNGFAVSLESMSLGTYGGVGDTFTYSYSVDGQSPILGSVSGVAPGSPAMVNFGGMTSAINGSILLKIDLVGSYDPPIDNLAFSQVVPEPGLLGLVGFAGLALVRRRCA